MLDWLTFDNKGSGCEGLTIPPFISMLRRDHISIFVTPSPQRYWSSHRFSDSLTMPSINHQYFFILIPGFDHSLHFHFQFILTFDLIFLPTFNSFFHCVVVFLFLFVSTFMLIFVLILCMQTKWETIMNVLKRDKRQMRVTIHEKGGMHNPQKGVIITHKCDLVKTRKYFDREL